MVQQNVTVMLTNFVEFEIFQLGVLAAKLAEYNFEWRFDTVVLFQALSAFHLQAFLITYARSVIVRRGKYLPPHTKTGHTWVPQFVIYGEDIGELSDSIQFLIDNQYDCTAKYIIVCTSSEAESCDENPFFDTLAHMLMANIVFLKLRNGIEPAAYTFYPMSHSKCWHHEPIDLDIKFGCPDDKCYKNQFPGKFYDLQKCEFRVSTIEQQPFMTFTNKSDGTKEPSGSDGDILKLVVSMLNATLVLTTPSEGDWGHYENNNWTGSLGQVFNNHAHCSMCVTPLSVGKYGNFQISFTYDSMDLIWAAAMPEQKPAWEKLLRPFDFYLRVAVFFTFLGIIILSIIFRTKIWSIITKDTNVGSLRASLLFYSWVLFLGMPVTRAPKRVAFRAVVCSWIWFCVIIRGVYQGALIGSLKVRASEDNLKNFQEVIKKKYPFGGVAGLREYYSDDRYVYDNWHSIGLAESEEYLDKISERDSDFVLALNRELVIERLLRYNGRKQVQILPDKIANSPMVMFFKKNSNLVRPVSTYLTVILEGGFSQRLYGRYVSHVKLLFKEQASRATEPLRLQHFTGSFAVLFFGWIMAIIFFLVEYACGKDIANVCKFKP